MELKVVVTGSQSGTLTDNLKDFIADTGWSYVPRKRRSLETVRRAAGADAVVVWEPAGPVLYLADERFFFHPNMAKNRISQHRKGLTVDVMERLVGVRKGDKFLDCTLGLGADSVVAGYLTGSEGLVVGLDSSPVIAKVVKWGMRTYQTDIVWLKEAISRVKVIQAEHLDYLRCQPDRSYDIVYFDPMFANPVLASSGLAALRLVADYRPLSPEAIREAVRVAQRRVVVKERRGSPEFQRLGIETVLGGESSRLAYGVIDVGGSGLQFCNS